MAVTGAIFNSLIFGGVNSADYGIYITGEAVYNAPVRAVEMVSVPGRNGAVVIDQGHWENIEVTYPAGTFGNDQADFRIAMREFRNAIVSQLGYQRLTDTYHPDEYRMGVYVDGLEVSPVNSGASGEFEIHFNCKPQRWLTSGETSISVDSGDTLINPTRYEAKPLLEVDGYGAINIDDSLIQIQAVLIGEVPLSTTQSVTYTEIPNHGGLQATYAITFDGSLLNSSDRITVKGLTAVCRFDSAYDVVSAVPAHGDKFTANVYANNMVGVSYVDDIAFRYGTSASGASGGEPITIGAQDGSTAYTATPTMTVNWSYNGANTLTIDIYQFVEGIAWMSNHGYGYIDALYMAGNSTKSALGAPLYFDLEIGEAYKIENGTVVSVNNAVTIPVDLPVLKPLTGTAITFDSTITSLKIVPRWWVL